MAEKTRVVVLGAGIIGLTTALLLSKDESLDVTVIAKHMPGDYDIEYASPWAGANYEPMSAAGTPEETYERNTWPELQRLARHVPEAGIHFQDCLLYNRRKDVETVKGSFLANLLVENPWYKDVVPNFRALEKHELPSGFDSGNMFQSVCINAAIYLPWLVSQGLKHGVVYRRRIVKHVEDAARHHSSGTPATVVVNATGLGSLKLGGVEDTKMIPARGQVVIVRNEPKAMMASSGTDDDPDDVFYIMNRAAGGGCILGGCYQKGNWDSQPDINLALRIMKRAVEWCPELTGGKGIEALDVIRHGVGLRPSREGGIRLESEKFGSVQVVHCYGHGGYGYQSSYGSAQAAVSLVMQSIQTNAPRVSS